MSGAKETMNICLENRRRALERMPENSALLLFGAPHFVRNGDSEYKYRQNSDLFYLGGWEDPEVALFLCPGQENPFQLFVQPRNPEIEVWTGSRPGPEGAVSRYGADEAHDIAALPEKLVDLLQGVQLLYHCFGQRPEEDALVNKAISAAARKARRSLVEVPKRLVQPRELLDDLRVFKTPLELGRIRRAVEITAEAHVAAMKAVAPGVGEHELEALIDYTFRRRGGSGPGYSTIVGGGVNACTLHYVRNDQVLADESLVLVDAGCEFDFYTADVTRTYPVNGTFTDAQREVYEVVLAANVAAIDACVAGTPFQRLQEVAVETLTQGLVDLGLLEGEVTELIEEKAYRRFYMHNIGHWLGMDAHDAGAYSSEGNSRKLEPGMVLTIEPGLYLLPNDEEIPERYRGIGVRIEDDVLVTEGEAEVLTASIPKAVAELEEVLR